MPEHSSAVPSSHTTTATTMECRSNNAKRIRASKPKVRSGCITCKVRRVKCDETRPGCLRCKKFGRECDGYLSDQSCSRRNSLIPLKPRPSSLNSPPPVVLFPGDEQERSYYQVFCDQTATDLAGFIRTDFWRRIALQESYSGPAIRHAVVALGALTKSHHVSDNQLFGMTSSPSNASVEHREYALSQYNKAIVNFRQALAKKDPHIRTALMACLLFVGFENFHGDYEAAARHMQCGLSLLEQWQSQNAPGRIADLYTEEVFQIFARYNCHSCQHLGSSSSLNPNPKLFYWESIGKKAVPMPVVFTNVHEARMCWDVLMERCIDYHKISARYMYALEQPLWIIEEADACAVQVQQFENAFWPLLHQPPEDESHLIENGAVMIYLQNKLAAMFLQVSVVRGESHWDGLTQHFEEIIVKSAKVVERSRTAGPNQPGPFAFELGIIPPLHITAVKCRDPRIRRQAIALLLSYPYREGCWDAFQLAKVDSWIMKLEEEGADGFGFIPEESRWRLGEVKTNAQERWISVKCIQDTYDINGQWTPLTATREHRITW